MTLRFPYAVRDFEKIVRDGHVYLDRTHYIPMMENWGYEILFMRPRRFGKSLWLSTLMNYYDLAKAHAFEQLFGSFAVGQAPTPLRNSYLVMRWDFSRVASQGPIEQIQDSLNNHVNSRVQIFQQEYGTQLQFPIQIDSDDALSSFDSLVNVVRQSGQKLYLFIDEYDNFANEMMMASSQGRQSGMQQRYLDLVQGEGMFKTFFKNLKSAGSGDGLDRIFMTGVSPIVLNDVTSGANVFQNITWEPEFNELCGFTAAEIRGLAQQVVEACQLPARHVEQIVSLMHNYYNGSRFIDEYEGAKEVAEETPKVYNPTLALYFFDHFQRKCNYPKQIIDENLVPDDSKLAYIAGFEQGKALLENALSQEKTVSVQTLRRKFGVRDLFDPTLQQDGLAVLLCYLGGLTSAGDLPDGGNTLEIPNLVMRKLYAERILAQMTEHDNAKIDSAHRATSQLFVKGKIEPVCAFVEEHLLPIYDNRDARHFNELTLKTLFITLLHHTQMYLIDSEPAIGHQYGDLLMIVRPGMRTRGLFDILIEFKHLPLNRLTVEGDGKPRSWSEEAVKTKSDDELMALDSVKDEFAQAKHQLQGYVQTLMNKYDNGLDLRAYALVSLGFGRILWREIDR